MPPPGRAPGLAGWHFEDSLTPLQQLGLVGK
jgi:hypothetical protein